MGISQPKRPVFESLVLCDWLTISQTHLEPVPALASDVILVLDGQTGELKRETGKPINHLGSYDTNIRIGSDGTRVTLSGNVGRFGRPDNVFGYDLDSCKRICNQLLRSVDLPEFTPGEFRYPQGKGDKQSKVYTGALVSRVDMTCNLAAGHHSRDFLYWLGSQKVGRTKVSAWGDGETVYWGKNTKGKTDGKYINSKAYLKGLEIQHRIKQQSRKRSVDTGHAQYLLKLSDWCNSVGLVRHESNFAERFLNQNELKPWHRCTTKNMMPHYLKQLDMLTSRCEMRNLSAMPKKVRATYYDYINGVNLRTMKKSTFYAHRKTLLEFGIDIAMPTNVRAINTKPVMVDIKPATMPDFYQLPKAA